MKNFTGERLHFRAEQKLHGNPEQVFPLLCPVREYEWIDGWDCRMIYSESGIAELDCIFTTAFSDEGEEEVWVVDRYEPPQLIQFIRVNPLRVIRYRITLSPAAPGESLAVWEQTITGLSGEGNDFLENYTSDRFASLISTLEKMINYHLETGGMLARSTAES